MPVGTSRYYYRPIVLAKDLAPARWGIYDRKASSDTTIADAHDAATAERIVTAFNAGA